MALCQRTDRELCNKFVVRKPDVTIVLYSGFPWNLYNASVQYFKASTNGDIQNLRDQAKGSGDDPPIYLSISTCMEMAKSPMGCDSTAKEKINRL